MNVVVGKPIVKTSEIFQDEEIELITEERFLPKILVQLGIFKSNGEVKRNRPELFKELNDLDFIDFIKVGKKKVWILVGE